MRQQDVTRLTGVSTSRFSGIERRDVKPSQTDRILIERNLPPLPGEPSVECKERHASTNGRPGPPIQRQAGAGTN
jgi:hypothetical protein